MTVVFMEGWDDFNGNSGPGGLASAFPSVGGSMSLVAGHNGGQALRQPNGNSSGLIALLDSPVSSFTFVSFVAAGGDTDRAVSLFSGATEMVGWRYSTDGSIGVYRGATLLGSSAPGAFVNDGNFHLLEFECEIHDTTGRITVYWDNVQVINLTGVDTRNGTPTTVDRIRWNPTATGIAQTEYDHTFVTDNSTRPSQQYYIETTSVDADGATLNWVPSTGVNHFAVVDEIPVSTADYLQASMAGNIDELVVGDLATSPTDILAIKVAGHFQKTDVTVREVALGIKSGATTSAGTTTGIAQTGTRVSRNLNTDPATAAAWTEAGVEALRLRPEVTV